MTTQTNRQASVWKTKALGAGLLAALAAAILALCAFSVPAIGKQSDDPNQSASGSGKKDAAVSIESSTATTPKASFASGSGENFFGVKVSNHGNLLSFESPANQEAVFDGREGYAVCSTNGSTKNGHDTGEVEGGFGTPTFVQPTAGAFPLTVTRKTTDGKFQLKQVWNKPDATEKDVTVTMTLKNISNAAIEGVLMSRSGDFDVGTLSSDLGARTDDSAWLWDDAFGGPPGGLMLTALSFRTSHLTAIETASTWLGDGTPNSGTRQACGADMVNTPTTAASDLTMKAFYLLGNLSAGQSKTVKFEYGRM
jgi:hypothetical protein